MTQSEREAISTLKSAETILKIGLGSDDGRGGGGRLINAPYMVVLIIYVE